MNVAELHRILTKHGKTSLRIQLPGGDCIPPHFHVTEVGRIDKRFIDCGGTRREATTCLIQAWTADDFEHRLSAGRLAQVIDLAEPILGTLELPVEVEFGAEIAIQYELAKVQVGLDGLTFVLTGKQTDCLAKDRCGVGGNSDCCG